MPAIGATGEEGLSFGALMVGSVQREVAQSGVLTRLRLSASVHDVVELTETATVWLTCQVNDINLRTKRSDRAFVQ